MYNANVAPSVSRISPPTLGNNNDDTPIVDVGIDESLLLVSFLLFCSIFGLFGLSFSSSFSKSLLPLPLDGDNVSPNLVLLLVERSCDGMFALFCGLDWPVMVRVTLVS